MVFQLVGGGVALPDLIRTLHIGLSSLFSQKDFSLVFVSFWHWPSCLYPHLVQDATSSCLGHCGRILEAPPAYNSCLPSSPDPGCPTYSGKTISSRVILEGSNWSLKVVHHRREMMVGMIVVVEVWWEAVEAQVGWEKWGKWQPYHTGCVQNAISAY